MVTSGIKEPLKFTSWKILETVMSHLKCNRARCKTCPFIRNVEKISGPKRSIKITDHFTCTSANVIYCITCTLCKTYLSRSRGTLNLPNHSKQHMTVYGVSHHQGSTESRKTLEQKLFIFQIGTLNPNGVNERFSFN